MSGTWKEEIKVSRCRQSSDRFCAFGPIVTKGGKELSHVSLAESGANRSKFNLLVHHKVTMECMIAYEYIFS
jgi:hypothetical protein